MALLRSKVLREIVLTAMALLILLSGLYGLFKSKFGSTSGESRAIAWAEALGGSVSYNDKRRRPEESRFATRIDLHETSVIDFSPLVELADLNVAGSGCAICRLSGICRIWCNSGSTGRKSAT